MKSKLFGVLISMALLYSNIATGQGETDKLIVRSLDEELAISNFNVLSMLRDADELMWFATAYGLYRYDGTHTKIYFNTNDSTCFSG